MTDQTQDQTDQTGPVRAWPLAFLAAPAFVAIWSGWVGLGELAGFGVVHPLPGIWDDLSLNTAITLPIGVEAYAAYALRAWLMPGRVPARARSFARASAIGALVLGALGQVAYHLLAAADVPAAPWQITTMVACLPVAVLGMGAALAHLLRAEPDQPAEQTGERRTAPVRSARRATAPTPDQTTNQTGEQTGHDEPDQTGDSGPDRTVVPIGEGHRTGQAAVRNARELAVRYPDHIPPQKTAEREMKWGAERTRKALAELARMREQPAELADVATKK